MKMLLAELRGSDNVPAREEEKVARDKLLQKREKDDNINWSLISANGK